MSVGEGQWVKGCWGTGKGQEREGEGKDRKEAGWEKRWQWGGGDWEGGGWGQGDGEGGNGGGENGEGERGGGEGARIGCTSQMDMMKCLGGHRL